MANLSLGFFLMAIGMVTVFAILLIVIFGSRGIINLMNRIVPAENVRESTPTSIPQQTRLIIESAISELTSGKGRISKITKI